MIPGDTVTARGRVWKVFKVVGNWVGLIDPDREPLIDDTNKQQVAHIAVQTAEVTR
ncbi:hypothetical protein [Williamsia deligens]|uniref:Uncharacterized protein n=1 Tax=Williamsia deligens TaxID=321325 RepID=A0ABW3GCP8_9NOCA|nr:hypothetical protein [Williamsia deligens]MCP2196307.1 hypothetical protein [Williamsia deligens]